MALVLFGLSRHPWTSLLASVLAGASWIAALATINVSAQVALPEWVRGRGLALFVTVMFGAMTLGSAIWGQVAALTTLSTAHYFAAAGALIAIPLLRRWKLQTAASIDLTASMHWPPPLLAAEVDGDRGPVMITVEYRVEAANRDAFLHAIRVVARERKRDGALDWGIFEDAANAQRYVEVFTVNSWVEHLRQHERFTADDLAVRDRLRSFHLDEDPPEVSHFIHPDAATGQRRWVRWTRRRQGDPVQAEE